jgi:hypothetical protein
MSHEEELSAAEREMESALRQLRPAAAEIDPIACAYEAGVRTARQSLWRWRAAAALIVAVLGTVLLLGQPGQQQPMKMAVVPDEPTAPQRPQPPQRLDTLAMETRGAAYLRLRNEVLDQGLDALPAPPPAPADLGEPLRVGGHQWRPS